MSTSNDSDVRTLHDKLRDLGQHAAASVAPASYKAFQGYQIRGAFMVGYRFLPQGQVSCDVFGWPPGMILLEAKPLGGNRYSH